LEAMMFFSTCLFVFLSSSATAKISRSSHLKQDCSEDQRSKAGDRIAVHFQLYDEDGKVFNSSAGGQPYMFTLGKGEAPEGWDAELVGVCAGEVLELVEDLKSYKIAVEVIVRTVKETERNARGILVRKGGKCRDAKVIKLGDTVTIQSVARLPNYLFLLYPHPTGNIPITIKLKGIPGVKIDASKDTIRTGEGKLVPGWEMGLLGACEGETRMINIGPDMAWRDRGLYQKIPPKAPVALEVEVLKVERDSVDTFLQQGAEGKLFNFSL